MTLKDHLPDILARRQRGETLDQIATVYGVTGQRVQQLAPQSGIKAARTVWHKPHDDGLIKEARAMWREGLPAGIIAEELSTPERLITRDALIGLARRNKFGRHPMRARELWTERESAILWRRRQRGERIAVIASDLNRSESAVYMQYLKLRRAYGFDLS